MALNQPELIRSFIMGEDLDTGLSAANLHLRRYPGAGELEAALYSYAEPLAVRIVQGDGSILFLYDDVTNYSLTTTHQQGEVRSMLGAAERNQSIGGWQLRGRGWKQPDREDEEIPFTVTTRQATREELREVVGLDPNAEPAIVKRGRQTYDRETGRRLQRGGGRW